MADRYKVTEAIFRCSAHTGRAAFRHRFGRYHGLRDGSDLELNFGSHALLTAYNDGGKACLTHVFLDIIGLATS